MCGIAGFYHRDRERPAATAMLDSMVGTLMHRGPDGQGSLVDGALGIGMRRLAVIDVDHGQQPGAAYNGHYRDTVYHPLVASYSVAGSYDSMHEGHRLGNGFLHALLRQGQVHTAQGIRRFLQEVVAKAARAMSD